MNIPLHRSSLRPTPGIVGEVRYNTDTDEMQTYDGTGWKTIGEMPQVLGWEKWRAWYPVRVNGKWNWGNIVYRRRLLNGHWKYGNMFDVLREI